MMFFKTINIIQLVLLTGCVTSQIARPPVYEVEMTLSPPVLVNETRELGETLTAALCSRQADSWRISDFGKGEDSDSFSLTSNATLFNFPSQVLRPLGITSSGVPVFVATQGTVGLLKRSRLLVAKLKISNARLTERSITLDAVLRV